MHNAKPILIGLVIFVAVVTIPFWFNSGKAAYTPPDLKLPDPALFGKECIESKEWMAANHMQLLNDWRDLVVRDNERLYTTAKGRTFDMSLQNTCMNCHNDKEQFCDKCHAALSVQPYCWSCHIEPKAKGAK